ncbi:MAG: agmatinase [Candidatus Omnitrophota bacterium]|nr:MAG: agmatinase [Candidatus Omnitrophota bacterium]
MEDVILQKRFGDIDKDWAGFKKSKVHIIQAPYEGTLSYVKGAAGGPQAIIDASMNMELFDDELQTETYKIGIHTSPPLELDSNQAPEKIIAKVKEAMTAAFQANKFPVLLGGEHSVSIGGIKAAKEFFDNLSVLHLDAHYDLKDEYMNSKYNHACIARRIRDICPIVEVGVRSISKEEKDFLDTSPSNVKVISVYDILETHDWKKKPIDMLSDTIYITIDLDILDPSLMPSVGTPEPGGLGWYEFLDFLKTVTKDKKVVGFDVVELSPKNGFEAADFLAAKLIYRLLGYIFFKR